MDAIINRNVEIIPFILQLKYNQKYIIPFSKITLNENICNMAYILDCNLIYTITLVFVIFHIKVHKIYRNGHDKFT